MSNPSNLVIRVRCAWRMRNIRRMSSSLSVAAICIFISACVPKEASPIYITSEIPDLPDHCDLAKIPNPPEPKLPDADADDIVAAKDRLALKKQLRTVKSYRQTCNDQLKVLFPQGGKPTS